MISIVARPLTLVLVVTFFLSACHHREENRMANLPDMNQAIAALRDAYAAFNRGDMNAAVASLDADIEWIEPKEFPGGGAYRGRDSAQQYLAQSRAAWAEVSSEPERFIPAGHRIVVFVHARVRAKGSSTWQDVRLAAPQAQRREHVQARVHARHDRQMPRGDDGAGAGEVGLVSPCCLDELVDDRNVFLHPALLDAAAAGSSEARTLGGAKVPS